jgi:hypothetical protein
MMSQKADRLPFGKIMLLEGIHLLVVEDWGDICLISITVTPRAKLS